jgi:hypothetical protein
MSLDDRIAEARARAEATLAPEDWMVVRALEATETSERYAPPPAGDTSDLPKWSAVSETGTSEGPLR